MNQSNMTPKKFRVQTQGGADLGFPSSVAIFEVDEKLARDIVELSGAVQARNGYRIERPDCRTEFVQFDPETAPDEAEAAGEENTLRTEGDMLVVGGSEFFFRANIKHTDMVISSAVQPIAEIAAYFGLGVSPNESAGKPKARPDVEPLRISVRKAVDEVTDEEDADVTGLYAVIFNVDTNGLSDSRRASMALDIFHAHQAIACLDDFDIDVINSNDERIEEDEQHEAYAAADSGIVEKVSNLPMAMDPETYVHKRGVCCPSCGSSHLCGGQLDVDGGTASQPLVCNSCGAEWSDVYILTGYSDLERGVNNLAE